MSVPPAGCGAAQVIDPGTQRRIDAAVAAAPSGLGGGRLVCIDGPAGSGKTTLATGLAEHCGAQLVHMDDLYAGWDGASVGVRTLLADVLAPLSRGLTGRYHRYDWDAGSYAEAYEVPPLGRGGILVVEGCFSATRAVDAWHPTIVWVEASDSVRLARGLARDGAAARDHWERWMVQEAQVFADEETRSRAAVRLDGQGHVVG